MHPIASGKFIKWVLLKGTHLLQLCFAAFTRHRSPGQRRCFAQAVGFQSGTWLPCLRRAGAVSGSMIAPAIVIAIVTAI